MPLSRYQIRNEYSLADPELYRAADKDDPEALLEGVAMAGLVGVLRQLGDLAEFAAEIFHDLHEEVMATAARGHGLMVRVQQLELEFPSIEKAFLAQTNHSQFISNPGVEWHPNLHADQNLITQGDLPRFIMDSYEECRGPPRLFLLDKFDVAGAGACLKRYTDPSFYKVETSFNGTTNTEVQRERKARKTKKKGSRWRNGETPEALPTSHVKLQQLLLEERIENGVSDPARLVKLKRRLNASPFDSKTGKSYMEKIINTPSAEDKLVHEVSIGSPASRLPSNITTESGLENVEISVEKSVQRNSNPCSSPDMEKAVRKSSKDYFTIEKEIAVDGERKADASGDDYQYNDIASEMDNYVDALTTMESEIETDTEIRAKSETGFLQIEKQGADSDANKEQLQAQFSDSQSIGNSTASDDGNSSSKKGISSFSYSDTASTSAENTAVDGDDASANVSPSNEKFEDRIITDTSSNQVSSTEEIVLIQTSHADSAPTNLPGDEGAISTQRTLGEQESDELFDSALVNAEENATNVDDDLPFTSKLSDVPLQTDDDSPNPESAIDQSVVDKVDEEDSNVFSSELTHIKNIVEVAPEKESVEVLLDNVVQSKHAGDSATASAVTSVAEEPPFVPSLSEFETCRPDVTTDAIVSADDVGHLGGKIEVNSSEADDRPNITEQHISKTADDVYPLKPDSADTFESETTVEALAVSVPDIDDAKEDESNSQFVNFTDLQEECVSGIEESDEKGLEIDAKCVEQNHRERGTCEEDTQQATSPELNSVTMSSDYSKSEVLNNVAYDLSDSGVLDDYILDSPQTAEAENTLHLDDVIAEPSYSENSDQDSDSKSPRLNNLVENAEDILSSPTHSFAEQEVNLHADNLELPHAVEESPDSSAQLEKIQSPEHMDQETPVDSTYEEHKVELKANELDFESISQLEQTQQPLNQTDKERCFDASPESSPADHLCEASAAELFTQPGSQKLDISEQVTEEPLRSTFPVFGLVPVVSEINLEEMPPLPPLPPVQWRMGKTSLASERATEQRNLDHFPQMFPIKAAAQPSSPFLPHSAGEYENSQNFMVRNTVHSSPFSLPIPTMSSVNSEHYAQAQPMNLSLEVRETYEERPQHSSLAEQGTMQPWVNPFSTLGTIADTSSSHASGSPREELIQPPHQLPEEENSKAKKIEPTSILDLTVVNPPISTIAPTPISDLTVVNPPISTTAPSPIIENEPPQYVLPTAEGGFMWSSSAAPFAPAIEDGKPNGNRLLKLMRPRSPLIDAVAAHDKSKLRKVTERVQPHIQKVDERDSLLEQIRTKSFNLKPAIATRPSIQGPKTNLRVAAILEKANAIRQALAGSDEDDDADSWSSD